MSDVGTLGGDGFRRGEVAAGGILGGLDGTEVAALAPRLEFCSHISEGGLPHAATQRIAGR